MNMTKDTQELLSFLLKDEEDEEEFKRYFWQGENRQFFSVSAYRVHKITQRSMNFYEFDIMIGANPTVATVKQALEELFQQPVSEFIANVILNNILKKVLTTKSIYDKFIEEERKLNVTRLVTNCGW